MQGNHIFFTVHVPGTLAADIRSIFTAPFDLQLVKVSAANGSANTPTLCIGDGTTSGSLAHMPMANIGVSGSPAEFGRTDFVGDQFPRISQGDNIQFTLDYDASGSAGSDFTLNAVFSEG